MIELSITDEAQADSALTAFLPVDLVCTVCGYGVAARRIPPSCPMCRNEQWEPAAWQPFATRRHSGDDW